MSCFKALGTMPRTLSTNSEWQGPQQDITTMSIMRQKTGVRWIRTCNFVNSSYFEKDNVNCKFKLFSFFFFSSSSFLKTHKLLVLKNDIEIAQFQSNSPQYLPISEALWKALLKLPTVYDYGAYRNVLKLFGTHYLSAGSLGGSLEAVARIDQETEEHLSEDSLIVRANTCRAKIRQ